MNPETAQIDFGWARNLEHPHGGFNFFESCLILVKPGSVGAVSELLDAVGHAPAGSKVRQCFSGYLLMNPSRLGIVTFGNVSALITSFSPMILLSERI